MIKIFDQILIKDFDEHIVLMVLLISRHFSRPSMATFAIRESQSPTPVDEESSPQSLRQFGLNSGKDIVTGTKFLKEHHRC